MIKNDYIMDVMPTVLADSLKECIRDWNKLKEIRIRVGQPVLINYNDKECMIGTDGFKEVGDKGIISADETIVNDTVDLMSNHSLYAVEDQLRKGFITIKGGNRAGITGHAVISDGTIKTIRNISSINIRVAHDVINCANYIMPKIKNKGNVNNTLIVSPPGGGKTTMLRDVIRQLSKGGYNVSVVDERQEIAACVDGKSYYDLGPRTDTIDACPKDEAIDMLVRSMAPDVIAVDEIGLREDASKLVQAALSGVSVIATAHGNSLDDIKRNRCLGRLIEDNYFSCIVILAKKPIPGTLVTMYVSEEL